MLFYHSTPLQNKYSPAKLFMGRKLRTTLPSLPSTLKPKWDFIENFRKIDSELKKTKSCVMTKDTVYLNFRSRYLLIL